MSPFLTTIPIDLDRVTKLLPKGSHIEDVSFDKATQQIEMRWSNQYLTTPYSFALPFTVEQLEQKQLPQGAIHRNAAPAPKPEAPRAAVPVAPTPKKEQLKCASCGKKIHWDGLSQYVHSDGKTYRHPCTPKKQSVDTTPTPDGQDKVTRQATSEKTT